MALPTKTLGPFTFKIDRPKGTVKKWPTKTFTYPCDYGYFPRLKGEDEEGLDAFVGDDPSGHLESFQKLKPNASGKLVLDETKFLLGVSDEERSKIYGLYGQEVHARKTYRDFEELGAALECFKPKRRQKTAMAAGERSAAFLYGVKLSELINSSHQARPAEAIDIAGKLQNVWQSADAKVDNTGSESAVGTLPDGGMVG